jgi:organic hydroperoxide reductase OsmC/OhrA
MAEPRPKRFDYAVSLDRQGRVSAGDATLEFPDVWKPEHLVLAGLAKCTLKSLRYHAERAGIIVEAAGAAAHGEVTRREEDGRYGFVAIECRCEVTLAPVPDGAALADLQAKAERDCFVGASLRPAPTYVWSVT